MNWAELPGPASFIADAIDRLRDGISVIIAAPTGSPPTLASVLAETLRRDHWSVELGTADADCDPLHWFTEFQYLEPQQWVGWTVEKLFQKLPEGRAYVIDGVTAAMWESWRAFLMDFEVASRGHASALRPVLVVVVRGVATRRLQAPGAALALRTWQGVVNELDTLIHVDRQLHARHQRRPHHKLVVRMIAALSLWDLELADFLIDQPEQELFDPYRVLRSAQCALQRDGAAFDPCWEGGGKALFDGIELVHPFALLDSGDPEAEVCRRIWSAQAAELLPLIELRRRELALLLARHLPGPIRHPASEQPVQSLLDLEIGPLAYLVRAHPLVGSALRDRVNRLAEYRNTLAHLQMLSSHQALDTRLYG